MSVSREKIPIEVGNKHSKTPHLYPDPSESKQSNMPQITLYRCPKCSMVSHNPAHNVRHLKKCGVRSDQMEKLHGYYKVPENFGDSNNRETLFSSIIKTQVPWNEDDLVRHGPCIEWQKGMWDESIITRDTVAQLVRAPPVRAGIIFFDSFLHKDLEVTKYKNFIKNGNHILQVMYRSTDPSLGIEVVVHPMNETTLENIAVWVLKKAWRYGFFGPASPHKDVDFLRNLNQGKALPAMHERWMDTALRGTENLEYMTACDTFTGCTRYHDGLAQLKEHIRQNLPTKDHIKYRVTLKDGDRFAPIPKAHNTFWAWVCRGCRKSFHLRSKAKRHQTTCKCRETSDPPPIFAVLTKYELDRPVERQIGWSANINEQADALENFMRTHCEMGDKGGIIPAINGNPGRIWGREYDASYMNETVYESIFRRSDIEDVIVSVWSHFFARQAIKPEYCACFRTDSSVYIYTTQRTPGMTRSDPCMVHESINSPAGRRLVLLEMSAQVFQLIRIKGTTPEDLLTEQEKRGKREQIARRNVYLLDRKLCPDMEAPWSTVDFHRVNFEPRAYPNLRKFVDRLIQEIPHVTEINISCKI